MKKKIFTFNSTELNKDRKELIIYVNHSNDWDGEKFGSRVLSKTADDIEAVLNKTVINLPFGIKLIF